jgi:peptidyl-prolyl cis-trans isomerase D
MAIIGSIRKRSGLLVIIIGVALAAFVLGDFLKPGKRYRQTTNVGVVGGENVPYTEFIQKVEEQLSNIKQRAKKENLSAEEVFSARQMTWQQITNDLIMGKEYDNLGITVTSDELFDLVQGKEPHQYILQYFKDPNTQQYNPQMVINFLKQLDQIEPDQKKNWLMLEKAIKDDRLRTKYNNLIGKGFYMPKAFAKMDYEEKNKKYDIRLVAANYQSIDEKTITLTDADYQKYYDDHKYMFDQEAAREVDFVTFELQPSQADRDKIAKEVSETFVDFQKATDVPAFVNANSDTKYDSTWKKEKSLPPAIDSLLFKAPVGFVIQPYIDNNKYNMYKLLDVQMRPDSMKASHILISFKESAVNDPKITRTKDKAKQIADSIFNVLKKDAKQFALISAKMNDDGSVKTKGGDLGWFADETMVPAFNKFCVEAKPGEIKVVETVFGFHVIQLVEKKVPVKKIRIAMVDRRIEPSSQTFQDIYNKASEFAGENRTIDEFSKAAKAKNYNLRTAEVKDMDNSLPGVNGARGVVQWSYLKETEKGTVSSVFEAEGTYVVAALKTIREKGIQPLEVVKQQIEPMVKRDKKAEKLMEKIKTAGTSDLYQLASKIGAAVDTIPNMVFFNYNLQKYGPEPEVIGTVVNAKVGSVSAPVKGNNNVYVFLVDKTTEAPETKDYTMYIKQQEFGFLNRVGRDAFQALEKMADIEDNRVIFY